VCVCVCMCVCVYVCVIVRLSLLLYAHTHTYTRTHTHTYTRTHTHTYIHTHTHTYTHTHTHTYTHEHTHTQIKSGKRVSSNLDVPFIGDVWDRPVIRTESSVCVYVMKTSSRWLAKKYHRNILSNEWLRFVADYRCIAMCMFVILLLRWILF